MDLANSEDATLSASEWTPFSARLVTIEIPNKNKFTFIYITIRTLGRLFSLSVRLNRSELLQKKHTSSTIHYKYK